MLFLGLVFYLYGFLLLSDLHFLEKYRLELSKRIEYIIDGLSSIGLKSVALDTQSLIELFYNTYNPDTYDQIHIDLDLVGDASKYLVENSAVKIAFVDDKPIMVGPPDTVELEVVETDPGLRGDTASGGTKPAVLETGLKVQVPLFIQEKDVIKIDTRNDSYMERV